MKPVTVQILNDEGHPTHEQTLHSCRTPDEIAEQVRELIHTAHPFNSSFRLQIQSGIKGEEAQRELLLRVCRKTQIYDYDEIAPVTEYYDRLEPRHKKMLYVLAFYSTVNATFISGYAFNTINSMRQEVYEHTPYKTIKELRSFCHQLENAGIKLEREPRKDSL